MSVFYVDVSRKPLRTYCPLDAEVFIPDQWDQMTARFQKAVKEKRYFKLPYDTWRGLTHDKDYAYRVVSFICNSTDHDAFKVSIKTYLFDPNDLYVFADNGKEYTLLTSDGSLGEYLKNVYFNSRFKLAEVDVNDLPANTISLMYTQKQNKNWSLPKEKLTEHAWCAIYYKRPWISCSDDKAKAYSKAIAEMEAKMVRNQIETPDWAKPEKSDMITEIIGNAVNGVIPELYSEEVSRPFSDLFIDAVGKSHIKIKNGEDTKKFEVKKVLDMKTEPVATVKNGCGAEGILNDAINILNENNKHYTECWATIDSASVKGGPSTIPSITDVNFATTTSTNSNLIDWKPTSSISVNIPSTEQVDELTKRVENIENKMNKKEKEDNKMKMFNFDFGPIKDNDAIRMSPYGLAVKGVNGNYQAYDKTNGEMMDVDIINFKADNMFFKIPVAIDNVGAGDVVIHNRKPMVVFGFSEQGDIVAVDIAVGEKKTIMPAKSPFGFNFITKIVSLFDNMTGNTQPDTQHPFGNMLPFMLMGDQSEDFDPMLMCMMTQGQNGCANMFSNPMMMYFLISNKESNSDMKSTLMAMMAMSMMSNPQK